MPDDRGGHDDKTVILNQKQAADQDTVVGNLKDAFPETTPTKPLKPDAKLAGLGIGMPKPADPAQSAPEDPPDETRILNPVTAGGQAEAGVADAPQSQLQYTTDDPVVGWLVVIDGPGKGNFRPIFYGNNTIGRDRSQRVPVDFGDSAISSEEQAYIQYNYKKREFLFIPNLAKPNVVEVNEDNPASAVQLQPHDKIRMGETTLLFLPLCGADFEWGDLGGQ